MTEGRPALASCAACACANAATAGVCGQCGAALTAASMPRRPPGAARYIVIGALLCLVTHNLLPLICLMRRCLRLDADIAFPPSVGGVLWALAFGAALGYGIYRFGTSIARSLAIGGLLAILGSAIGAAFHGQVQALGVPIAGITAGLIPAWILAHVVAYDIRADDAGRTAMRSALLKEAEVCLFAIAGLVLGYLASGTILQADWYFFFYTPSYSASELVLRLLCLAIGIASVVMSCRTVTPRINLIGLLLGIAGIGWEAAIVPLLFIGQLLFGRY